MSQSDIPPLRLGWSLRRLSYRFHGNGSDYPIVISKAIRRRRASARWNHPPRCLASVLAIVPDSAGLPPRPRTLVRVVACAHHLSMKLSMTPPRPTVIACHDRGARGRGMVVDEEEADRRLGHESTFSSKAKTVPVPGADSTVRSDPCAIMIWRDRYSPSPAPSV